MKKKLLYIGFWMVIIGASCTLLAGMIGLMYVMFTNNQFPLILDIMVTGFGIAFVGFIITCITILS